MSPITAKRLVDTFRSASIHMVGDGFHVRNLFPSNPLGEAISPFLMLDYAGPAKFEPTERRRGVGEHPHRGFETVTIVLGYILANFITPKKIHWRHVTLTMHLPSNPTTLLSCI